MCGRNYLLSLLFSHNNKPPNFCEPMSTQNKDHISQLPLQLSTDMWAKRMWAEELRAELHALDVLLPTSSSSRLTGTGGKQGQLWKTGVIKGDAISPLGPWVNLCSRAAWQPGPAEWCMREKYESYLIQATVSGVSTFLISAHKSQISGWVPSPELHTFYWVSAHGGLDRNLKPSIFKMELIKSYHSPQWTAFSSL